MSAVQGRSHDAALLTLLGEVMGLLDLDEFRSGLLTALRRTVPSRWASLNEVGPGRVVAMAEPHLEEHWFPLFAELAHENPIYQRWERTQDGRAYRFSDVPMTGFHATRLHREVYIPLGIHHQIAFALPNEPDHMLAVVLSRDDRDYSDAERDLLNDARPYLIQAYRNAVEHSALLTRLPAGFEEAVLAEGLTEREAQVLRVAATGASSRAAADEFNLSPRTIEKLLERAYRKLGVSSRDEAMRVARELEARHSPGRSPEGSR